MTSPTPDRTNPPTPPEESQRFEGLSLGGEDRRMVKLILLGLLWAYMHHFCAGIRFLLLDLHKGIDLPTARKTSVAVLAVSLTLTVIIGAKLW